MFAVSRKRDVEIREKDLQARSLVADIVPMLDQIPEESVDEVVKHLEKALKVCETKMKERESEKRIQQIK